MGVVLIMSGYEFHHISNGHRFDMPDQLISTRLWYVMSVRNLNSMNNVLV